MIVYSTRMPMGSKSPVCLPSYVLREKLTVHRMGQKDTLEVTVSQQRPPVPRGPWTSRHGDPKMPVAGCGVGSWGHSKARPPGVPRRPRGAGFIRQDLSADLSLGLREELTP